MSLSLNLQFHNYTKTPIDTAILTMTVTQFLSSLKVHGNWQLEVLIVGDRRIHTLNNRHRGIDNPTDVLSFPLQHSVFLDQRQTISDFQSLGSLVICPNMVMQKWADDSYGATLKKDVYWFVVIHGLMHLLGYDHQNNHEHGIFEQIVKKFINRDHSPLQTK